MKKRIVPEDGSMFKYINHIVATVIFFLLMLGGTGGSIASPQTNSINSETEEAPAILKLKWPEQKYEFENTGVSMTEHSRFYMPYGRMEDDNWSTYRCNSQRTGSNNSTGIIDPELKCTINGCVPGELLMCYVKGLYRHNLFFCSSLPSGKKTITIVDGYVKNTIYTVTGFFNSNFSVSKNGISTSAGQARIRKDINTFDFSKEKKDSQSYGFIDPEEDLHTASKYGYIVKNENKVLKCISRGGLEVWRIAINAETQELETLQAYICDETKHSGYQTFASLSLPILYNDKVIINTDESIFSFDERSGEQVFKVTPESAISSKPLTVGNNQIICILEDNLIQSYSVDSSELIWSIKLSSTISGAAGMADNLLYIGTDDGNLTAIQTNEGKVAWHINLGFPLNDDITVTTKYVACGNKESKTKFLVGEKWKLEPEESDYKSIERKTSNKEGKNNSKCKNADIDDFKSAIPSKDEIPIFMTKDGQKVIATVDWKTPLIVEDAHGRVDRYFAVFPEGFGFVNTEDIQSNHLRYACGKVKSDSLSLLPAIDSESEDIITVPKNSLFFVNSCCLINDSVWLQLKFFDQISGHIHISSMDFFSLDSGWIEYKPDLIDLNTYGLFFYFSLESEKLDYAQENFKHEYIYTMDEESYGFKRLGAATLFYNLRNHSIKSSEQRVQVYRQLLEEFPQEVLFENVENRWIIPVYIAGELANSDNFLEAQEMFRDIIFNFPNCPVTGYEFSSSLHPYAYYRYEYNADRYFGISKSDVNLEQQHDINEYVDQLREFSELACDKLVKSKATLKLAEVYRYLEQYEEAVKQLLRLSSEYDRVHESGAGGYSYRPPIEALRVLSDIHLKDYNLAENLDNYFAEFQKSDNNRVIAQVAFEKAKVLDLGIGRLKDVLYTYENFSDKPHSDLVYSVNRRIDELKKYTEGKMKDSLLTPNKSDLKLRYSPYDKALVVGTIQESNEYKVLYENPASEQRACGVWYKITDQDNSENSSQVGWVKSEDVTILNVQIKGAVSN